MITITFERGEIQTANFETAEEAASFVSQYAGKIVNVQGRPNKRLGTGTLYSWALASYYSVNQGASRNDSRTKIAKLRQVDTAEYKKTPVGSERVLGLVR